MLFCRTETTRPSRISASSRADTRTALPFILGFSRKVIDTEIASWCIVAVSGGSVPEGGSGRKRPSSSENFLAISAYTFMDVKPFTCKCRSSPPGNNEHGVRRIFKNAQRRFLQIFIGTFIRGFTVRNQPSSDTGHFFPTICRIFLAQRVIQEEPCKRQLPHLPLYATRRVSGKFSSSFFCTASASKPPGTVCADSGRVIKKRTVFQKYG